MKYKVVVDSKLKDFNKNVSKQLTYGWELEGGVSVSGNAVDRLFCQAMTHADLSETEDQGNLNRK